MHAGTVHPPDDTYTHGHHESVLRSHRWRTAENSAAQLLPHLRDGMEILDVGCGPGTITVDLARRVGRGRVVGIDRSADVIAAVQADAGGLENVTFATGDVYRLDLADEQFDVVHAHQVRASAMADQAVAAELTTVAELDEMADAFRIWAERPDGWFAVLHGELIARA